MAQVQVKVKGTALPGEIVAIQRGDELLWSEGTGRGATDGKMVGSVVAKKQTLQVSWGMLTQAQYNAIRNMATGFVAVQCIVNGATVASFTGYRGAISGEVAGIAGGTTWWRGVTVDFIER